MDESLELNEDTSKPLLGEMGTHFVRSVTYGAEIVASFKFKGSRRYVFRCFLTMIFQIQCIGFFFFFSLTISKGNSKNVPFTSGKNNFRTI